MSEGYQIGQGRRNQDSSKRYKIEERRSNSSDESCGIGHGRKNRNIHSHAIYRDDISDQISSFLAKISYSDATPKTSEQERAKQPLQSHPRYAVKGGGSDSEGFRRVTKQATYNKKQKLLDKKSFKAHKQAVDWRGRQRDSTHRSNQLHRNSYEIDYSETENEISEERKPRSHSFGKHHKHSNQGRIEKHPKNVQNVRMTWSRSRSRSIIRRPKDHSRIRRKRRSQSVNSAFRISKTPTSHRRRRSRSGNSAFRIAKASTRQRRRRSESDNSAFRIYKAPTRHRRRRSQQSDNSAFRISKAPTRHRRRRSQSDNSAFRISKAPTRHRRRRSRSLLPWIKCMPLKHEKRKTSKKKTSVEGHVIVEQREIKHPIPFERPKVITLYPKNQSGKDEVSCPLERTFLEDQGLPCKCFKCKRKYEQLQILKPEMQKLTVLKKANVTPITVHQQQKVFHHPRVEQKCVSKCWCDVPVIDDCIKSECNVPSCCKQDVNLYENCASFKLNSFRQCLDPNITEYFHSILEQINYY